MEQVRKEIEDRIATLKSHQGHLDREMAFHDERISSLSAAFVDDEARIMQWEQVLDLL